MKIIPNYIQNAEQIIAHLKMFYMDKFSPRVGDDAHTGIIPNLYSNFLTLKDCNMERQLLEMIFAESQFDPDLIDFRNFIQIQYYPPGAYICPHFDVYSINKLHLVTLTTSDCDGLVISDGKGGLIKIYDEAGQYIDFDNSLFHWVDPVKDERFTMVIAE